MRLFKPSPKNVPRTLRNSPEGKAVDVAAELAVIARAIPEGLDMLCHGGRLSEILNGNLMDRDFEGDAAFMVTSHAPIIAVVWTVGFVPGDCAGRAQNGGLTPNSGWGVLSSQLSHSNSAYPSS